MASLRVSLVPQACSRAMVVADELPTALPPAFLAFLQRNGLDASIYAAAATLPRYIRCAFLLLRFPLEVISLNFS